jgi:hypothetical protein
MGLELRHRLERDLSLRLSATIIWNYPTLAGLATHLQTRLDPTGATGIGPSGQGTRDGEAAPAAMTTRIGGVDARLRQVEELSDDAALWALRAASTKSTR